jgi:hypothetical protein
MEFVKLTAGSLPLLRRARRIKSAGSKQAGGTLRQAGDGAKASWLKGTFGIRLGQVFLQTIAA